VTWLDARLDARLAVGNYTAAEVVDVILNAPRTRLVTLFFVLDKSCRQVPPSDEAQRRWLHEFTCLAAMKSLDISAWQGLQRRPVDEGGSHAHVVTVPTTSSLVAALGLSQLMGLQLAWGAQPAGRSMIDLSHAVTTTDPLNAVLTALADELDRLEGKSPHLAPDRVLTEDEIGSLLNAMDKRRAEETLASIFLRVPKDFAADNLATLLEGLSRALNITVASGGHEHDKSLVHRESEMTVASLKAKLDDIFSMLASFTGEGAPPRTARAAGAAPAATAPPRAPASPTEETHWDVFISHASEDKSDFVRPLVQGLEAVGLRVWFDAQEIQLGDSISGKINEGLKLSRFGVVVLSPDFLRKGKWVDAELNALLASDISSGTKRVLPVCKGLSISEAHRHYPLLADKLVIMADQGLPSVVAAILTATQPRR
jgi:hypothetical protein